MSRLSPRHTLTLQLSSRFPLLMKTGEYRALLFLTVPAVLDHKISFLFPYSLNTVTLLFEYDDNLVRMVTYPQCLGT